MIHAQQATMRGGEIKSTTVFSCHSGEAPDVQVLETVHRNQNLLGAAANSTRQMMGKHC